MDLITEARLRRLRGWPGRRQRRRRRRREGLRGRRGRQGEEEADGHFAEGAGAEEGRRREAESGVEFMRHLEFIEFRVQI